MKTNNKIVNTISLLFVLLLVSGIVIAMVSFIAHYINDNGVSNIFNTVSTKDILLFIAITLGIYISRKDN